MARRLLKTRHDTPRPLYIYLVFCWTTLQHKFWWNRIEIDAIGGRDQLGEEPALVQVNGSICWGEETPN